MTNNQKVHEAMGLCEHEWIPAPHGISSHVCKHCDTNATVIHSAYGLPSTIPDYENSISDAWKIVEWMQVKRYYFQMCTEGEGWWSWFTALERGQNSGRVEETTAPKAIVAAFLKAMEVSK